MLARVNRVSFDVRWWRQLVRQRGNQGFNTPENFTDSSGAACCIYALLSPVVGDCADFQHFWDVLLMVRGVTEKVFQIVQQVAESVFRAHFVTAAANRGRKFFNYLQSSSFSHWFPFFRAAVRANDTSSAMARSRDRLSAALSSGLLFQ